MRTIAKLFGKSPFIPLQELMIKINSTLSMLPELFEALIQGNRDKLEKIAEDISFREHEADITKTLIRGNLPHHILMPVDRRDLLEVIATMDGISDLAEDIAVLLTIKELKMPEELIELFKPFLDLSMKAVEQLSKVFNELDELLQASFGGPEAKKIMEMIDEIGLLEHKADIEGRRLAKALFSLEDKLKPLEIFMFFKIFNKVGDIGNFAEKVGNRIRMWLIIP